MKHINQKQVVVLGALVILATVLLGLAQRVPKTSETSTPKYAYLVACSGEYLKIDVMARQILSHSNLWAAYSNSSPRVGDLGKFDGCLVQNVQHIPGSDTLYAVVPADSRLDSDGQRQYWISSMKLPTFAVISQAGP